MIYLMLTFESLLMGGILLANNLVAKNCKDKDIKNMQYINWVGAAILFIVVLIMKIILRSGGASFSQRYDIGVGSPHGSTDAGKYAVDATIFGVTILGIGLLILNGIKTSNCKKYDWNWLYNVNWIFMSIYFSIALYGIVKMVLNARAGNSIL